jgi:NADH-quinone oxidoreductase subunit M
MPIVTVIGALGIIFTAVYVLRGVLKVSYGPMPGSFKDLRDARLIEAVPMITLAAFIVLIGVYPAVLSEPMQQTVIGIDQWIHNIGKMGG